MLTHMREDQVIDETFLSDDEEPAEDERKSNLGLKKFADGAMAILHVAKTPQAAQNLQELHDSSSPLPGEGNVEQ